MSIGYFYYFKRTEPFLVLSELIIYSLIPVLHGNIREEAKKKKKKDPINEAERETNSCFSWSLDLSPQSTLHKKASTLKSMMLSGDEIRAARLLIRMFIRERPQNGILNNSVNSYLHSTNILYTHTCRKYFCVVIHNKYVTRAFAQKKKNLLLMRSPWAMDEVPAPLKGHGQGLKWTSASV